MAGPRVGCSACELPIISMNTSVDHLGRSALKLQRSCRVHGHMAIASYRPSAYQAHRSATAPLDHELLPALDPSLDSLIERWLSNRQASTSAPNAVSNSSSVQLSKSRGNGNSMANSSIAPTALNSSSGSGLVEQLSGVSVDSWQAILGPVAMTVDSSSTLEDGDELFALSDSLCRLGGSLQELQALATQLQHQQQQSFATQSSTAVVAAASVSQQLAELLSMAAQQAAALDDTVLLNLLAIATVILDSSIKTRHVGSIVSGSTDDRSSNGVQAAAAAAIKAALDETWQRPAAAAGLDATQLTSLTVIFHMLNKLGVSRALPSTLLASAYQQLLSVLPVLTSAQLAVCCWCLSGLQAAPPSAVVAAAVSAATAAVAAGGMDVMAICRMSAALLTWQPYLAADAASGTQFSKWQGISAEYIRAASQHVGQLLSASGSSTNSTALDSDSSNNSSSSGSSSISTNLRRRKRTVSSSSSDSISATDGVQQATPSAARVAHFVAQLCSTYCCEPAECYLQAVASMLQAEAAAAADAAASGVNALSSALCDAAAAMGYLFPYWQHLPAEEQQGLLGAVFNTPVQQQRAAEEQQMPVNALPQTAKPFLAAIAHSAAAAVAAPTESLRVRLDAVTAAVLTATNVTHQQPQQQQTVEQLQSCGYLLTAMATLQHGASANLPPLISLAMQATERSDRQLADQAAVLQATADIAAALCTLQPRGWQQHLQVVHLHLVPCISQGVLPLRSLLHLAKAATSAGPPAAGLAQATRQQLLQPETVPANLPASKAADALQLLASQVQAADSSAGRLAEGSAAPQDKATQQCLRCLYAIQRDSRGLLPAQIVPLLSVLLQLQQQCAQLVDQQEQAVASFVALQQEAVAAVALQLEDSAQYMSPHQLSGSVRWLALLKYRPALALSAVVSTAAGRQEQFSLGQSVWLLWGLTKLRFSQAQGVVRLLKGAIEQAVLPAALPKQQQQVQQQLSEEQQSADQTVKAGTACSPAALHGSIAAMSAPLEQLVALFWVVACRGYQSPTVETLLQLIVTHQEAPTPAIVSSALWSSAKLSRQYHQHQQWQGLQPQLLQWCEQALTSSSASSSSLTLTARAVVNTVWAMNKLGHVPSVATQSALLSAGLQCLSVMDPVDISCFTYCISSWGCQLNQQQLQQLEQHMAAALACLNAPAAVAGYVNTEPASVHATASSAASGQAAHSWDGPAVCSSCWALVKLGANLQHQTLGAAEHWLQQLLPTAADAAAAAGDVALSSAVPCQSAVSAALAAQTTAAADGNVDTSLHSTSSSSRNAVAPSAADLAMFGEACRHCNYNPSQLLAQVRDWLLLLLAKKGPSALLKLRGRGLHSIQVNTAPAAASTEQSSNSSSSSSSTSSNRSNSLRPLGSRSTRNNKSHMNATAEANVLVTVLMLFRQVRYADQALLQQLEQVAASRTVKHRLTGRQIIMLLRSFRLLGFYPDRLWQNGLRRSLLQHIDELPAADIVQLLETLAHWRDKPGVTHTHMRQYILPKLVQRLLGQQWVPKWQAAKQGSSSGSGSSISLASVGSLASLDSLTITDIDSSAAANAASSGSKSSKRTAGSSRADAAATTSQDIAGVKAASSPSRAADPRQNLIATLHANQLESLLHSIAALDLNYPELQRRVLKRLGQCWAELSPSGQIAVVQAAGRLQQDIAHLLELQSILPRLQQGRHLQQQQQQQRLLEASAQADEQAGSGSVFSSPGAACSMLWTFGNVGKHPGPAVLNAALSAVVQAAASSSSRSLLLLPLREMSTALYAAAVLQELQHPAAVALVQQLQATAAAGQLLHNPQFEQQSQQLAACFLISQISSSSSSSIQAASRITVRSSSGAAEPAQQAQNPWLGFNKDIQQRLLEGWRRKVLRKSQRQPNRVQQELIGCLRQLGWRCRANAVIADGCVCIDVAATSSQGEMVAIELLGPHNAALNTQRPLGPARLKWRLLAARGYRVVPINQWQWEDLDSASKPDAVRWLRDGGEHSSSSSMDGVVNPSQKLMFLQPRLLKPGAAAAGDASQAAKQTATADGKAARVNGGPQQGASSKVEGLRTLRRPLQRPKGGLR